MQDRVALVTGASSGIGACIAQCLLERGWRVYGTSRHPLEQVGGGIRWIQLDITDEKAIRNASGMLAATEGRLDALVNNAGMGIAGPLELLAPEEMALQMDTNFSGTLRLTQTMLPLMKEGGRILNVSSLAAIIPIPFQALYSASKAALEAAMEAWDTELAPRGIHICCLQLGDTHTGFTHHRRFAAAAGRDTLYGERMRRSVARMERDEENGMDPRRAAACAARLLEGRHFPLHKVCGTGNGCLYGLRKLLPRSFTHLIVGKIYGGGGRT
jgi:NAD(P)-dependent dehydrogenase (short-subunit alcohol dehydrogenase family)